MFQEREFNKIEHHAEPKKTEWISGDLTPAEIASKLGCSFRYRVEEGRWIGYLYKNEKGGLKTTFVGTISPKEPTNNDCSGIKDEYDVMVFGKHEKELFERAKN